MKIGIIGAGAIGATIARRLSRAGHDVAIANSRGPETVDPSALRTGAHAVPASEVAEGASVVIVSVNLGNVPNVAALVSAAEHEATIIDTSNYYPLRDGFVPALDKGQVESLWVAGHYSRPIVKAWNAITAMSFADKAAAKGTPGRIAIPVAADDRHARTIGMALVEDTGFDAFDAGELAHSWRQQPGSPAYCTDRTKAELPDALAAADASRSPLRRDLVMGVVTERAEAGGVIDSDYLVALNRAVY